MGLQRLWELLRAIDNSLNNRLLITLPVGDAAVSKGWTFGLDITLALSLVAAARSRLVLLILAKPIQIYQYDLLLF